MIRITKIQLSGFVAILIVTSMDFGGLTEILKIANDGGRFPNQFEFDPRYRLGTHRNRLVRHLNSSWWTVSVHQIDLWIPDKDTHFGRSFLEIPLDSPLHPIPVSNIKYKDIFPVNH